MNMRELKCQNANLRNERVKINMVELTSDNEPTKVNMHE